MKLTMRKVFLELEYVNGVIEKLAGKLRRHDSDDFEPQEISRLLIKSLNEGIRPAIDVLKSDITPFMLRDE